MSDLFEEIYKIVREIPSGKVTTYGAIASYLGTGGGARVVGWAMNASHSATEFVPAHRVVNRIGMLTGKNHFEGFDTMKKLLESEGITIEDDKITDFQKHFWNPNVELA